MWDTLPGMRRHRVGVDVHRGGDLGLADLVHQPPVSRPCYELEFLELGEMILETWDWV